jgi:hypothetical protein
MTIYSIYRATNINNGKVYIGYTGKTLNERKAQHHIHHRKTKFSDALKQHNGANFVWEVIYQSRDGDHCLNVMESYFITEYNSYQNGYNSTSGGSGFSYDWDDARRSARAEHQRQLWLDDDYRTKLPSGTKRLK